MSNDFLPQNYEAPASNKGAYFKPTETKTKIRVMSSAITWWLDWNDKQPVRTKERPQTSFNPDKPAKHFRAFIVWNYAKEELQIWEVTQASVREQFTKLIQWERGNPQWYDVIVWKEGKDLDTKYFVTTTPQGIKEIDPAITDKYYNANIKLEELYTGGNPFDPEATF